MSATATTVASVLNHLIEICKDWEEGFRTACADVKNADFQSLFQELSVQRQQFTVELQHLVDGLGEIAEEGGSIPAVLHRGWVNLRAAISGGDVHAVLAECERGGDSAVAAYREALEREDLPGNVRGVIRQQFMAVRAAHDRVRDLRDRFQD